MPEFLYIHIPFCIKKCAYCDFLSFPYNENLAIKYVDALCKELDLKKDFFKPLKTIYIGGGTPSILPNKSFKQIFEYLRNNFEFLPSAEITVEANPGTINETLLDTLAEFGVNRLSIGVQSFNDNELKVLGRIHNSEDAIKAIALAQEKGFSNFSIDLMYGIPNQTLESWKDSLLKAVTYTPAHISTYELTPEKGTPLHAQLIAQQIKMPDEEIILSMYDYTINYFSNNGYKHYEISNFAIPKFECIHNLNYWNCGEYVSAGLGAHSFINKIRSKNIEDLNKYIEQINNEKIPETETLKITQSEAKEEFIFLGLRKIEGISIAKAKELGLDILNASEKLVKAGYLETTNDNIRLTKKGLVISNTVIVGIFEKLGID
jgi:oxygen-independent coproporphyrinogen-3 oxidase